MHAFNSSTVEVGGRGRRMARSPRTDHIARPCLPHKKAQSKSNKKMFIVSYVCFWRKGMQPGLELTYIAYVVSVGIEVRLMSAGFTGVCHHAWLCKVLKMAVPIMNPYHMCFLQCD